MGLLQELDDVLGLDGMLVLANINQAAANDSALLRPGRIGRAGAAAALTRSRGRSWRGWSVTCAARRPAPQIWTGSPGARRGAAPPNSTLPCPRRRAGRGGGPRRHRLPHRRGARPRARGPVRAVHEAGHAMMLYHARRRSHHRRAHRHDGRPCRGAGHAASGDPRAREPAGLLPRRPRGRGAAPRRPRDRRRQSRRLGPGAGDADASAATGSALVFSGRPRTPLSRAAR